MCVRTYLLPPPPEFKKKDKGPAQSQAKEKVPNDLPTPSVFQLGSDRPFCRAQKRRTLEPFKDFPAFFGGLAGCMLAGKGGSRRPYFVVVFPVVLPVYGVQRLRGFLLFVLVTLSSSKVGTCT